MIFALTASMFVTGGISEWDMSSVENINYMFDVNDSDLDIDTSEWYLSMAINMKNRFNVTDTFETVITSGVVSVFSTLKDTFAEILHGPLILGSLDSIGLNTIK